MTKGQAMPLRMHVFVITDSCLDSDRLSCAKNWIHMPSTSGSHGRLADEIQVDFKTLKFSTG